MLNERLRAAALISRLDESLLIGIALLRSLAVRDVSPAAPGCSAFSWWTSYLLTLWSDLELGELRRHEIRNSRQCHGWTTNETNPMRFLVSLASARIYQC